VKCTHFEGVKIRSNENVSSLIDVFLMIRVSQEHTPYGLIYTPTLTCQKVQDMDNMHKQKLAETYKMEKT
jgi:hypothetical protein